MARVLLSQDFFAACLLLAEAQSEIFVEDLIEKAKHYQMATGRVFGDSREDFVECLAWIAGEKMDIFPGNKAWRELRLADLAPFVLEFYELDLSGETPRWVEEASWYLKGEEPDWRAYEYDHQAYLRSVDLKMSLQILFDLYKVPDSSMLRNCLSAYSADVWLLKKVFQNSA